MRTAIPVRTIQRATGGQAAQRRGAILVLSVFVLAIVMGFAAFTVDFGMITITQGQLQNAADSAAHAATLELSRSFGAGATVSNSTAESTGRASAVDMIAAFRSGDVASTQAHATRDVRMGHRQWNSQSQSWTETWGVPPYNMVEVTVRRNETSNAPLPLTFARVLGVNHQNLEARAVASVAPAVGFRMNSDSSVALDILPIAVDSETWNQLLAAIGSIGSNGSSTTFRDQYGWNEQSNQLSSSGDGVLELNIYPDLNTALPPGNRGTVDIGSPNNSTNDLKRQIVNGLNEYDLSFFPNGELLCSPEDPLLLNGDPGISAGIEASLKSIIGKKRAIPIFTTVSGPGNNATYTVIKFVGIRIMAVKLTGGPGNRYVTIQPADFSSPHIIRGNTVITQDSIVSKPFLIR